MRTLNEIRTGLRRNLPVLVGLSLCMYFSYHSVFGDRSYSRLSQLETSRHIKQVRLDVLQDKRMVLEERVVLLRPNSLSADMVEEQARFILGYQAEHEMAVLGN